MSKKFSNNRCVYCLKHFDKLTSDHVLPKSWYPAGIVNAAEKWQVPSCEECNQKHSKNEGELIQKLGLGFDPDDPMFSNIAQKAGRAINESSGRNEKDRKNRQIHKERLIQEITSIRKLKDYSSAIIPGFSHNISSLPIGIPEESLKIFAEKLVRGLTYTIAKTYIESTHIVDIYLWNQMPAEFYQHLKNLGIHFTLGEFFQAIYFFEPVSQGSFCDMNIWNILSISAIVSSTEKL